MTLLTLGASQFEWLAHWSGHSDLCWSGDLFCARGKARNGLGFWGLCSSKFRVDLGCVLTLHLNQPQVCGAINGKCYRINCVV